MKKNKKLIRERVNITNFFNSHIVPDLQDLFFILQHGITQTSELVNITDFFNSHIVPDLQDQDGKTVQGCF